MALTMTMYGPHTRATASAGRGELVGSSVAAIVDCSVGTPVVSSGAPSSRPARSP